MFVFEKLKRWWQERTGEEETPFDGDTPAWIISIIVHVVVLVVLTVLGMYAAEPEMQLIATQPEEELEELQPEEFYFAKDPTEEIGANSVMGTEAALAAAPNVDAISDVPTDVAEHPDPTLDVALNLDIPTGPNQSDLLRKGTQFGEGATGAVGAIDRITHEILMSLQERKTLVVWLFDQSGSLNRTRQQIHERFDRIYKELGVIEESGNQAFAKHADTPLLSSVMAFGKTVSFPVKDPTADVEAIKSAVKGIPNDPTGVENVFTATIRGVEAFQKYRLGTAPGGRRNIMFVVVSDEVGDDDRHLDQCVAMCQRNEVRVYVIGVPAPFGRAEALVKYVDPDPNFDQSVQWIPVRQGPESLMPERLKLAFTAGRRDRSLDELDSGFGPFALTRLCYETGGIYFSVHKNKTAAARAAGRADTEVMSARLRYFFDPGIMRRYRPDYLTAQEYARMLQQNKARGVLVQAARNSWLSPMADPQTRFPKRNEGALKALLDEAQKTAAKLEPKINDLYTTLADGKADREKETTPRWQAGYDLAMGRVLAMKVRTETYNHRLAELKTGKNFKDKNSDTWILRPADNTVGSKLEKLQESARMYLQRVIDEHPDTPWALLAERELETPLGWEWTEAHTGVNDPRPRVGNGNNNNNNPNDALNRMKKPKPKRSNIKL